MRPPRPTPTGAVAMNAVPRAASASAVARAGAGGCVAVLALGARRRDDVRHHARHQHGAGLPHRGPGDPAARPTRTPSGTSSPTAARLSTRSSCTGSSPMDGDGFVTQGDNNDWLDEDQPTEDEILGRLFLRIPQGGKALDALRSPGILLPWPRAARRARRRPADRAPAPARAPAAACRHSRPDAVATRRPPRGALDADPRTRPPGRTGRRRRRARRRRRRAACCSPCRPPRPTRAPCRSTQEGEFSYTGAAAPGTTYPEGVDRDRRHRVDAASSRPDRLLHQHRHRPGAGRRQRCHAPRRRGHRGRRLERGPRPAAPGAPSQTGRRRRPSPSTPTAAADC